MEARTGQSLATNKAASMTTSEKGGRESFLDELPGVEIDAMTKCRVVLFFQPVVLLATS
jgi:hypothetical protein